MKPASFFLAGALGVSTFASAAAGQVDVSLAQDFETCVYDALDRLNTKNPTNVETWLKGDKLNYFTTFSPVPNKPAYEAVAVAQVPAIKQADIGPVTFSVHLPGEDWIIDRYKINLSASFNGGDLLNPHAAQPKLQIENSGLSQEDRNAFESWAHLHVNNMLDKVAECTAQRQSPGPITLQ